MTLYFDEIDAKQAEQITRNFLEQYYSVFDTKSTFENETWLVSAKTSAFGQRVKKVRIDAKTGRIISCE